MALKWDYAMHFYICVFLHAIHPRIFSVRAISPHAFLCLVSLCPFYNVPFVTILTVEDVGPNLGAEGSVR
jgi:hypothetical protein